MSDKVVILEVLTAHWTLKITASDKWDYLTNWRLYIQYVLGEGSDLIEVNQRWRLLLHRL